MQETACAVFQNELTFADVRMDETLKSKIFVESIKLDNDTYTFHEGKITAIMFDYKNEKKSVNMW